LTNKEREVSLSFSERNWWGHEHF